MKLFNGNYNAWPDMIGTYQLGQLSFHSHQGYTSFDGGREGFCPQLAGTASSSLLNIGVDTSRQTRRRYPSQAGRAVGRLGDRTASREAVGGVLGQV